MTSQYAPLRCITLTAFLIALTSSIGFLEAADWKALTVGRAAADVVLGSSG